MEKQAIQKSTSLVPVEIIQNKIYLVRVRIFLISYQPRSQFVTTPDHNSLPA